MNLNQNNKVDNKTVSEEKNIEMAACVIEKDANNAIRTNVNIQEDRIEDLSTTKHIPNNTEEIIQNQQNEAKIIDDQKPEIDYGGDFMQLVTLSSIFVDKTMFIKEIIEDISHGLLINMPRRWGKSLNLDMLRRFLSIQKDENGQPITDNTTTDNYKLFAGGEVILKNV